MRKRLMGTLLITAIVIGASPISVSAEWKQQSNNTWGWKENGKVITGWDKINGSWYYFNYSGEMQTGWINDWGTWRYLTQSGKMKTGWLKDRDTWYYFDNSGAMVIDQIIDGYYLGENGAMQPLEENKVLFEDDYAKITYIGLNRDSLFGPEIKVEVENKYDYPIVIQTRDVSIDKYMVDGIFSEELLPGKKAIADILFMKKDINRNFKSIEGKFKIMNRDTWDELQTEEFSIEF